MKHLYTCFITQVCFKTFNLIINQLLSACDLCEPD
jgi:hypothetical protein